VILPFSDDAARTMASSFAQSQNCRSTGTMTRFKVVVDNRLLFALGSTN
jgi:uncharacterized membrane protein (UPF0127 family)